MSGFFPDPHGPVNEHPGPDFDRPAALEAMTHDLGAAAENLKASANPDATEAEKADAQRELDRAAAVSRRLRVPRAPAGSGGELMSTWGDEPLPAFRDDGPEHRPASRESLLAQILATLLPRREPAPGEIRMVGPCDREAEVR